MKLIARKACSFGGKKFYIGEDIPAALVLDPCTQEKRGVLAIVNDDAGTTPPAEPAAIRKEVDIISVAIHAEEGDLPLELTQEGLQAVVDVLTSNVEDAEPVIAALEDGDALILLHATDTRKSVKTAAEARAKALNAKSEESEGDQ